MHPCSLEKLSSNFKRSMEKILKIDRRCQENVYLPQRWSDVIRNKKWEFMSKCRRVVISAACLSARFACFAGRSGDGS